MMYSSLLRLPFAFLLNFEAFHFAYRKATQKEGKTKNPHVPKYLNLTIPFKITVFLFIPESHFVNEKCLSFFIYRDFAVTRILVTGPKDISNASRDLYFGIK